MGEEYHPVDLFGGAITTDLPTSFTDVRLVASVLPVFSIH